MKHIKLCVRHNEYNKINYYKTFRLVDEVPTPQRTIKECIECKCDGVVRVDDHPLDCSEQFDGTAYTESTFIYDNYLDALEEWDEMEEDDYNKRTNREEYAIESAIAEEYYAVEYNWDEMEISEEDKEEEEE